MIGAIAGDIIGSVYEAWPIKTKKFPLFSKGCRFTDDTVLTIAVADAILEGRSYLDSVKETGRLYQNAGYGGTFYRWLLSEVTEPYNSWGNGAAMRVSPVGFAFDDEEKILSEARKTAEITHNHPEGIKGAQATALTVFLAKHRTNKGDIRRIISDRFDYDLNRSVESIRPDYQFDISCQGTVPEAIICFLESESYQDAVRNAVSLGGDSDTLACIAGGIAEAFYGCDQEEIFKKALEYLSPDLLKTVKAFYNQYNLPCSDLVGKF